MKTNFLAKHKWWVLAIVLMIALMAVSVSYSAWDTLSAKAIMNAKGGDFKEKAVWSDHIELVGDRYSPNNVLGKNGQIDVGDIVTYGKFYQDTDAVGAGGTGGTGVKKPQRWIVVNIDKDNVATLLTEQVVVYGNYWGNGAYLNDYYRSTVRSWLNSGKGSLKVSGTGWDDSAKGRYNDNVRNDGLNGGKPFGVNENQVNKGFLDVAFTDGAETILVPKKITGMKYVVSHDPKVVLGDCTTIGNNSANKSITDLVWLPSYKEIYGTTGAYGHNQIDSASSAEQFSYFKDDIKMRRVAGATDYAWNASSSSYYNNGGGSPNGIQKPTDINNDGIMDNNGTWWWLRSPLPSGYGTSLMVYTDGSGNVADTNGSLGGVRPAVCVQL